MFNVKKEAIVGIVGLFVIIGSMMLYNLIRSNPYFSDDMLIKAEFRQIGSLELGASVYFNGVKVGTVKDIYLNKSNSRFIIAEFTVKTGFCLPSNTEALSYVPSPMYQSRIVLNFDSTKAKSFDEQEDCLQTGDLIPGRVASYISDIKDMLEPYWLKADTVFTKIFPNKDSISQVVKDAEATMTRIFNNTVFVKRGTEDSKDKVLQLIKDLEEKTHKMKDGKDSLNIRLDTLVKATNSFKEKDIKQLTAKIHPDSFQTPDFNKLSQAIAGVNQKIEKDTFGFGSFFSDAALKNKILNQVGGMEETLKKVRNHPERYVKMNKK